MNRSRRSFLEFGGLCLAGAALPLSTPAWARRSVRVRGVVRAGGRGLPGVSISDGLEVVATGSDGTYELVTSEDRNAVQVCVPASCRIPHDANGVLRTWRPIAPDSAGEATAVFDLEPLRERSDKHGFLLLADIQTQDADEMKRFQDETVPDLQKTLVDRGGAETFAVACGDIMYDRLELFPEYERGTARTKIPFVQVVGNHDLDRDAGTDPESTRTFTSRFGPRYLSFDRGAVHYVVLDDVFWHGEYYIGHVDAEQVRWLQADLARVERGRTVIVCLHIPAAGTHDLRQGQAKPTPSLSLTNRELLFRILEPYRVHVLAGHTHETEHGFGRGVHEHVAGAVCGAWWTGPICADGTPNGYAIYDVAGEGVSWRYKATGLPIEHQMRLYPRGSIPGAPQEILANVWDWDPAWRVVWFEDGEARGPMERRTGTDPLSVELHGGANRPRKRLFVDPYPTDHLFRALPRDGARTVTIEATDRFGRVSTERIAL